MLTKTPIKKTTRTTTKTTTQKKGFFKRRFNLQSRKVQFVVVILIVAILGGGWFTYKSFAATVSYSFSPANDTLKCTHTCVNGNGKVTESQKNGAVVLLLKPSASSASVAQASNAMLYVGNTYRMCAVVRGNGTISLTSFTEIPQNIAISSSGYQRVCGVNFSPKNSLRYDPSVWLQNYPANLQSNAQVYISLLEVELVGTPTTPAPAK